MYMPLETPSTSILVHSQAELLESLASLLHQIRHEGLDLAYLSFAFAQDVRYRLSLQFEPLSTYLGSYLEGFEQSAIHLHFTRYIPRSLLEGVKASLETRNYILASSTLIEV